LGGTVYVFRNRTGTTLKLLAYDGQGFWLFETWRDDHKILW